MLFFSEFIGNLHIAQRAEYVIKCSPFILEGVTVVRNASQFRVYFHLPHCFIVHVRCVPVKSVGFVYRSIVLKAKGPFALGRLNQV